ncbi:hypothetical protein ACGFIW_14330 [Micromonospora sp. NPDC048935]|uniref:hypothetical protein n=1 Tax=Micromonospora sp. NPDC048935 TaxID=3364262 RepID=UPI003712279C
MRQVSTAAVTIALLTAVLTGCTGVTRAPTTPLPPPATTAPGPTGTATPPTGTATPPPTVVATVGPGTGGAPTRVTLRTSGGFAGRGDAVTVEPDGQWTAVDRAGSRRTGRLTPADLGRLTGLAADPRLAAEARQPTRSTVCSDALSYLLTVGGTETGYADCPADAPPPPATQALVKLLLRTTGTQTR